MAVLRVLVFLVGTAAVVATFGSAVRTVVIPRGIPYDPDPRPDDPISIERDEFDEACQALAAGGLPMKGDRE